MARPGSRRTSRLFEKPRTFFLVQFTEDDLISVVPDTDLIADSPHTVNIDELVEAKWLDDFYYESRVLDKSDDKNDLQRKASRKRKEKSTKRRSSAPSKTAPNKKGRRTKRSTADDTEEQSSPNQSYLTDLVNLRQQLTNNEESREKTRDDLHREIQMLREQKAELEKEIQVLQEKKSSEARHFLDAGSNSALIGEETEEVLPGILPESKATAHKMVPLYQGSDLFLYPRQRLLFKAAKGAGDLTSMLTHTFFSKKVLAASTITGSARKAPLCPKTVGGIIGLVVSKFPGTTVPSVRRRISQKCFDAARSGRKRTIKQRPHKEELTPALVLESDSSLDSPASSPERNASGHPTKGMKCPKKLFL